MRVMPIHTSPNFKGLWEVKNTDMNVAGLGYVWDVSYVYHPFKNEDITGKDEELAKKVPETYIHQPDPELLRYLYCTKFEVGEKLSCTEEEFSKNKEHILSTLPETYSEEIENLKADKFFNLDDVDSFFVEEDDESGETISHEEAKKLYDDLMGEDL